MSEKTAAVMRATGSQGKGLLKHLTKAGWNVHALVSDATSDRAEALKSFGDNVKIHEASWKEPSSLNTAFQGCSALFMNQMPSFTSDAELQEAKVVLEHAATAGIQHVVLSTTLPLNLPNVREQFKDNAAAPAVLGKLDVEKLVQLSDLTWTILRPGYFTTNLLPPFVFWMFPEMINRKFVNSYGPGCVLELVDPEDVGAFAVAAFADPHRFGSKIISVVGEEMRVEELIPVLEHAVGVNLEVEYRNEEENEKMKDNPFIAGHMMNIGLDKFVDMAEVKGWGVPLKTFGDFVRQHKKDFESIATPDKNVLEIGAYATHKMTVDS